MTSKEYRLAKTSEVAEDYHAAKDALALQRARLLESISHAADEGALQGEIAEVTRLSRQRISQFLSEYRRR